MNELRPTTTTTAYGHLLTPPPAEIITSTKDRTSQVAQREIRGSSTPRERRIEIPFPVAEFQQAVREINFDGMKRILVAHGFKPHEVDLIEAKAKLLAREINRDHLVEILLQTAIEKGFLDYLPALPPFIKPDPKRLAELCRVAAAQFRETKSIESFELLRAIVKKYTPENAEACIRKAYDQVQGVEMLRNPFLRSFPEYHLTDRPQDSDQKDNSPRATVDFPEFPFRMALVNLATDDFCKILIKHGWQESDLDIISLYMKQLSVERRRFGLGLEHCKSLSSLDEICYRLINEGILNRRHSLIQIFPLLPKFDSFNADMHIEHILKLAADELKGDPQDPFLIEICSKIMTKYGPYQPI